MLLLCSLVHRLALASNIPHPCSSSIHFYRWSFHVSMHLFALSENYLYRVQQNKHKGACFWVVFEIMVSECITFANGFMNKWRNLISSLANIISWLQRNKVVTFISSNFYNNLNQNKQRYTHARALKNNTRTNNFWKRGKQEERKHKMWLRLCRQDYFPSCWILLSGFSYSEVRCFLSLM